MNESPVRDPVPMSASRNGAAYLSRPYVGAFVVYLLLAIAYTFPLVLHLSTALPHDAGDPLLSTAILWWNAHVVPFTERWWNGLAVYPAPGFLAFSDPRVGESLIATPLQWIGLGPVAAYNLTFLLLFPLSAIAAHWLAVVLTGRHDAALVAGLVYGFCPFRGAHLSHLELLAAFGMPIALASLHRFRESGHRGWLAGFSAGLVLQGLCSSYYLLFFAVLLAAWMAWFLRLSDVRALAGIVAAGLGAGVLLLPLIVGYERVHAHYGLARRFAEVMMFSADATALAAADPGLLLWGWTSRFGEREGLLFPGLTIVVVVAVYGVAAWRRSTGRDRLDVIGRVALLLSAACAAIAAAGWAFGPWTVDVPGLKMSSDSAYKTFTIAVLLACAWLGLTSRVRQAWSRRSAFTFYVLATALLFVCSFGPKPTFLGHEFLYKPPYAWLMNVPVFDSIRVPARFGMIAMLALAAAGAVACARLEVVSRRRGLLALVCVGVLLDGWVKPLEMAPLPDTWPARRAEGFTAVVELPVGDLFGDLAAMYRTIDHGRPTVNGSSGFEPPHYFPLKTAMEDRDPSLLDWLPTGQRVLVVVDQRVPGADEWQRLLSTIPRMTALAADGHWLFWAFEPPPAPTVDCGATASPVASLAFNGSGIDPAPLSDRNVHTWWVSDGPQHQGDHLQFDLGEVRQACGIRIALGEFGGSYPRRLLVDTSVDGASWARVGARRIVDLVIRGALDDPREEDFVVPIAQSSARFVRLTLDEAHAKFPWHMTDLDVLVR